MADVDTKPPPLGTAAYPAALQLQPLSGILTVHRKQLDFLPWSAESVCCFLLTGHQARPSAVPTTVTLQSCFQDSLRCLVGMPRSMQACVHKHTSIHVWLRICICPHKYKLPMCNTHVEMHTKMYTFTRHIPEYVCMYPCMCTCAYCTSKSMHACFIHTSMHMHACVSVYTYKDVSFSASLSFTDL